MGPDQVAEAGLTGAKDEFLLAATVQNLKKLVRLCANAPPEPTKCAARRRIAGGQGGNQQMMAPANHQKNTFYFNAIEELFTKSPLAHMLKVLLENSGTIGTRTLERRFLSIIACASSITC